MRSRTLQLPVVTVAYIQCFKPNQVSMYISAFIISITNLYFDYAFTNGDVLGFSIAAHDLYNKEDDNDNDNNGYRTNSSLESLSDHLLSRIKKNTFK